MIEKSNSSLHEEKELAPKKTISFVFLSLLKWIVSFIILVLLGYFFLYLSERFFR